MALHSDDCIAPVGNRREGYVRTYQAACHSKQAAADTYLYIYRERERERERETERDINNEAPQKGVGVIDFILIFWYLLYQVMINQNCIF